MDVVEQQTENLELHTNALQILLGAPAPHDSFPTPTSHPHPHPSIPSQQTVAKQPPSPATHWAVLHLLIHPSLITTSDTSGMKAWGAWHKVPKGTGLHLPSRLPSLPALGWRPHKEEYLV